MSYDAIILDNDGVLTHLTGTDVVRAAEAQRAALQTGAKPLYDDVAYLFDLAGDEPTRPVDLDDDGSSRPVDFAGDGPARPIDLAVVSNNQHATVEHILDVFGLDDLFSVAYGREPTIEGFRRRKPEPYYLELAVSELGAENALYVGDSNVDVLAADRAGVDVAFIRRPHRAEYELVAEPTYEIETLEELLPLVGCEPVPR
ncbi:HAD family hydrolase [Halegenticoccus soli]|uniref:HAD family hydrolase n=1 Tax=Halegenticoccus soli TaxID=1985678 RepID=UPI000C6E0DE3|nr:HAD-IA family hydrolase [Halegenticoccus soli]